MSSNTTQQRQVVTAVIVAHDGARLLPALVAAMREQTYPVDRAVGVDTGSRDRSGALLAELLGPEAVFGMEPATGYGAAIKRALLHPAVLGEASTRTGGQGVWTAGQGALGEDSPQTRGSLGGRPLGSHWIWLLHDDCEPAPDALERMLRVASRNESIGVLGPKLRDLADRQVLRETGLRPDRAGRRVTGIEPGEIDQGQHDGNRSVLAVSTAGMLIRRDVWEHLGGFDPQLPLFRDDIDFCWRAHAAGYDVRVVTDAVVYHRELSARQIRKAPAVGGQPRRMDRRAALYVLAVNLPLLPMLTVLAGCAAGSLARAVWFLLTKQQRRAADQLGAVAWLLIHPLRLWRARRRRAAGRQRAYAVLKAQIPPGKTLSRLAEGLVALLSRSSRYEWTGEHGGGMTGDPDDELPLPPPDSLLRRVFTSPGVLLFLGLLAVAAVAERRLLGAVLGGSGTLAGGSLAPAWGGASDLWREYLAGFHPVGVGSTASAPPYVALVAVLATALGGKPWLAVDVLLLGCVPIAGMAAYFSARRVTRALGVRIWIAVAYALLPVAIGAIAAGRLGSAVAFMLLPPLAVTLGRALSGRAARRSAWAGGLLVALAGAFAPLVWLMAAAGAIALVIASAVVWWSRGRRGARWPGWAPAANAAIAAALPGLVLMPWTFHLVAQPSAFLQEAGLVRPGTATSGLKAEPVLLLSPGGPGLPPAWVTAGLLAVAGGALLLGKRRRLVWAGWAVALGGMAAGLAVSRLSVISPVTGTAVPAWPGVAFAVGAVGLLLAATPMLERSVGTAWGLAASSAGLGTRLRLAGQRGIAVLLLGAVAAATPLLSAGFWLRAGVRGPVSANAVPVLPAFISTASATPYQGRTLVLRRAHGVLEYQLLRDHDPTFGMAELPETASAAEALTSAVAAMTAPGSGSALDAGATLGSFDIGHVLLPAPFDATLAAQLNSQAGLQSLTSSAAYELWGVAGPVARLRVLLPSGATLPLPADAGGKTVVPAPATGVLVLSEPAGGWTATLNGRALRPLTRPVAGWAQGFTLPSGGGTLVISHDDLARTLTLAAEAFALLAAIVLALPGVTTAGGAGSGVAADPDADTGVPAEDPAREIALDRPLAPVGAGIPAGAAASAGAAARAGAAASAGTTASAGTAMAGPFPPLPAVPLTAPQEVAAAPAPTRQPPATVPPQPPATVLPQPPATAPRRKGGSHRAARHSKPSRGLPGPWRASGRGKRDNEPGGRS